MYSRDYDYLTMTFQPFLWSFGGDWTRNGHIEGALNSPGSINALTLLVNLLQYNPPGAPNFTGDDALAS